MSEQRKRVLVVDDEPDVGNTIKLMLEQNNFFVEFYTDPLKALENFKPKCYDLMIIDVKMPGVNGFELYYKMISLDPEVKVLFVTALSHFDDYKNYKELVFPKLRERHFMQKPISYDHLLQQVYSIMLDVKQI